MSSGWDDSSLDLDAIPLGCENFDMLYMQPQPTRPPPPLVGPPALPREDNPPRQAQASAPPPPPPPRRLIWVAQPPATPRAPLAATVAAMRERARRALVRRAFGALLPRQPRAQLATGSYLRSPPSHEMHRHLLRAGHQSLY